MADTFIISDTHFGHTNCWQLFKKEDGSPLRPFSSTEEMDEYMVDAWNKTVRPNDKVYHLGDVVINRRYLKTLERLNGDKVLVKGNHDIFKLEDYLKYFRDIRACQVMDNILMTHIPVHSTSKGRFRANVHGHMHSNVIDDDWYINVSVEQIGFTPISFEVLRKRVNERN